MHSDRTPIPQATFEALRLAVGTSVGHSFAPFSESVELARAAEAGGLDFVSVGDHGAETFALSAAVAAQTTRMQLMSGIAQWTRTPVTLAHAAKTIQNLSRGRYWLGVGPMPRHWAEDHHGIPYEPVGARMRDYLGAVRAVLDASAEAPTDHEGRYFRSVGFPGHPITPERPVPMLLAATRPKMTEMAAELLDGVMLNSIQPLGWIESEGRAAIERGLARAERPRDRFSVGILRFCGIDADRARAYDHARRGVAFYFAIPYFRTLLEPYGFGAELEAGEAALARGDWEGQVAAVSDELVDMVAIAGTPEEALAKLRRYEGLVDFVVATGVVGQSREAAYEQTMRIVETFGPVSRRSRAEAAGAQAADAFVRPIRIGSPAAAPIRRRYVETPGGQLHVREHGRGAPVLLLHQTASSSVMWERTMRAFAPRHRLIAVDTPGFGASDPPPRTPTELAYYAGRLVELLDALELERVAVVGHHTGAMIGAELAAAAPERVERLAMIGAVVLEDDAERARLTAGVNRWQLDSAGDFVVEHLIPRMHLSVTQEDPEHMQQELTAYLQAGPGYAAAYDCVWSYDAVGRLPLIAAPTLCLLAEREPEALRDWTRVAAELIPHATLATIDGGSEIAFQDPHRLAGALGAFLAAGHHTHEELA